jgi:hypothetical protein
MTGEQMLYSAARLVEDRRKSYGDPAISMAARSTLVVTLGQPVTPAQVALCLIDLKRARA